MLKFFLKLFFGPIIGFGLLSVIIAFFKWGLVGVTNVLWMMDFRRPWTIYIWLFWLVLTGIIIFFYNRDLEEIKKEEFMKKYIQ